MTRLRQQGVHRHRRSLCPFSPLRSNYIAAWHAAKMMVPAKQGLVVNVSSSGGMTYLFNVAYGVGKAAVSRTSLHALKNESGVLVGFLKLRLLSENFVL